MSYFATKEFPLERPRGKAPQRVLSPSRLKRGQTRDEYIEGQVEALSAHEPPGESFIMKRLERSEAPQRGKATAGALSARGRQSDIFSEPRLDPQPKLRIRPEFGEETLQKIHQVDPRKEETAQKMNDAPTLVDKMYMCNYPMPHQQEDYKPEKKRFDKHAPKYPESEVPGFNGLGINSKPIRGSGLSTKPPEPYVPELPTRKPVALRHRNASVYNPLNGEKSAWYGNVPRHHNEE